jgi:hypothetical protein
MRRKVFIDTSEFVSNNFDYSNSKFMAILERCRDGQIVVGLPSITRREMEINLENSVSKAMQALSKARPDARVLRTLPSSEFKSLFSPSTQDQLFSELVGSLNTYLDNCNVEDISLENISIQYVFDLYFNKKPPFDDGKKKAEFPDAFALAALEKWGDEDYSEVLVASSDSDLEGGCQNFNNLIYVGKLDRLLERLTFESDEFLATQAKKASASVQESTNESLSTLLAERYYYLLDENGEVDEVRIDNVESEWIILKVNKSDEEEVSATFEVAGTFDLEADISYDDMETATYDREDGVYYVFNTINETTKESESFKALVDICFQIERPEDCEVLDIVIEMPRDIAVSTNEAKKWPYK